LIDRAAVEAILNAIPDPATGQGLVASGVAKGLTVAADRAGFVIEVPAAQVAAYAPVRDAADAALKAMPGMARVSVILTAEAAPAQRARRRCRRKPSTRPAPAPRSRPIAPPTSAACWPSPAARAGWASPRCR